MAAEHREIYGDESDTDGEIYFLNGGLECNLSVRICNPYLSLCLKLAGK